MGDVERFTRNKQRAMLKRDAAASQIEAIYGLGLKASTDPTFRQNFLLAIEDIDEFWAKFLVENDSVLEAMIELDMVGDFSNNVELEVRSTLVSAKTLASQLRCGSTPSSGDNSIDHAGKLNEAKEVTNPVVNLDKAISNLVPAGSRVRLPEIPLPTFDGRLQNWPDFRDRFLILVNGNAELTNIEKFYYLLGCLQTGPSDVIKGITVSDSTYGLAWSTLVNRYERPRQLATALVSDMFSAPINHLESPAVLISFMNTFSEKIALLRSLKIPDLGSFLLFALAVRCLPSTSRRLFEQDNTTDFPTVDSLLEFIKDRIEVLENAGLSMGAPTARSSTKAGSIEPRGNPARFKASSSKPFHGAKAPVTLVANKPSDSSQSCVQCNQPHSLVSCPKFKDMSIDDRYLLVSKHRLCMVCLGSNHWANKCKASCSMCHGRHNHMLHRDNSHAKTPKSPAVSLISTQGLRSVVLGTATVNVKDVARCLQPVRALVDPASQISIITTSCVSRLGLRQEPWRVPVAGLAGQLVQSIEGRVQLSIQSLEGNHMLELYAWILPTITGVMPSVQLPLAVRDQCSHLVLADPQFDSPAPVELLLGADVFPQVLRSKREELGPGLPTAFETMFGWILLGPIDQHELSNQHHQSSVTSLLTTSLGSLVEKFWQVEEPEEAPLSATEEGKCDEIFDMEAYRDSSGRFVVPLPFRVPPTADTFSGSRPLAVSRFERLERKLIRDKPLYEAYQQFMADYEALGHMSVAKTPGTYFIPHHAVHKMDGGKLKLRVVFDASARPSSNISLNDALFVGPKLQQDIVDILLRFRTHRVVFTADICKMYRQILLIPEHRQYQHIFWRPSPHDRLQEFELNTVTYGVGTAPYLALRVLREIALTDGQQFPRVQAALLHQTYVDDICTGADTVDNALALQYELISLLSQFGLELKKWSSNSPELLKNIPPEDQAVGPLPFNDNASLPVQVLGLKWDPQEDTFNYDVSSAKFVSSKRSMLSIIARIFDPLGLLAPVIFYAKHLMQCVWKTGVSWDDQLPPEIEQCWAEFVSELQHISLLRVPRFVGVQTGCHFDLCGFCDASIKGFAAIVYLRVTDQSHQVTVYLLGCKTKLAPTTSTTIPRLELCGAGLLARWMNRIYTTLSAQIQIRNVFAWSDSSVVLSWLNTPQVAYKVFVSNRLYQIHKLLPSCRWFHVSSDMNPADCGSRGLLPSELAQYSLYWTGPSFLHQFGENWSSEISLISPEQLPEVKEVVSCVVNLMGEPVEWFSRCSSFHRLLRIVMCMRRFIKRCLKQPVDEFFSSIQYHEALVVVVRSSQSHTFPQLLRELSSGHVISSRLLARLAPFIDHEGVIRVGGRLRHSLLSDRRKFPMLLSKDSYLSLLIARHWHLYACHAGYRLMSALICRQFWIIGDRHVIRRAVRQCITCAKLSAQHPQPIMSDLPAVRVQQSRPFSCVGIDYAGPLTMAETSLRKARQYKIYIAVFVCMVTKAVHLEVVTDLTTDAFLAAFDRFVSRRGLPTSVYSDCGTNFVGAARKLSNLVNDPKNREQISSSSVCSWHFNPPSAPHFGGLWEAAVRSTKHLLIRVVGNHVLTLEEFVTILCRLESALNSRPLTPMSNDPNDLECLTPGHFLIGKPLRAVPEAEVPVGSTNLKQRWKLLHQLYQAYWRRWSGEYLNSLQMRGRWAVDQENIKLGELVILKDQSSSPLVWKLGRVHELLPGPDGVVRVVKIMTTQGLVTRPVVKIVPLPVNDP